MSIPDQNPTICSLCGELSQTYAPLHKVLIPEGPASRVLVEYREWLAVPSLGPLVPGHLLILPRQHFCSVLGTPHEVFRNFTRLVAYCTSVLRRVYGTSIMVFEHGSMVGQQSSSGACITHAHLHLLPGSDAFIQDALTEVVPWHPARSLWTFHRKFTQAEYLIVGRVAPSPGFWLHVVKEPIQSQFLRMVFAATLQNPGWNWREHINSEVFMKTITDWTAHSRSFNPPNHSAGIE